MRNQVWNLDVQWVVITNLSNPVRYVQGFDTNNNLGYSQGAPLSFFISYHLRIHRRLITIFLKQNLVIKRNLTFICADVYLRLFSTILGTAG